MTRKEVFAKIRELQLEDVAKEVFGRNYTLVSSAALEELIANTEQMLEEQAENEQKQAAEPTEDVCPIGTAFIRLVSHLRANRVLSPEDATDILSCLQ